MSDLISRDDAIRAMLRLECEDIETYGAKIPEGFDADPAVKALKTLPSAQQWIPVTERLPDSFGDYLVSVKSIGWNYEEYVVNDIAYWDSSEGFHKADEVVAWMPLPEPYKEEDDG